MAARSNLALSSFCSPLAVSRKHEHCGYECCDRYHLEVVWDTKHSECPSACQPEHDRAYEPHGPSSPGASAQEITHRRHRRTESRSSGIRASTSARMFPASGRFVAGSLQGLGLVPADISMDTMKSVGVVRRMASPIPRRVSGHANLGRHTNWLAGQGHRSNHLNP